VALVDLQMPELGGLDVLKAIREANPDCHVILLTGNPTIDTAIAAVKLGARDYLQKPIDFGRLGRLLSEVVDGMRRRERLLRVEADVAGDFECEGMIGRSTVMQELFDSLRRYAPHMRSVLVTGETAPARSWWPGAASPRPAPREAVHHGELLRRRRNPVRERVVRTRPGRVHRRHREQGGLFEHADGGTLFLDEAGELPLSVQAKLLRAVEYGDLQRVGSLDTRRVDVNVIAATNRNLRAEAAAGRFRTDLFYRLSTIEIALPPLRDRARTSRTWPRGSSANAARASTGPSRGSRNRRSGSSSTRPGRATSGSCATCSSAPAS